MNKILSIVWNTLVSSTEWHLFDSWVQANAVQEISLRVRSWFFVLSRKFFSVIAPDFTQCNFCFLQLSLWFSLNIFGIFEFIYFKVEKILKGSLDSIPSPSPSVKFQIMRRKVSLRYSGKTLLGDVNKLFVFKSLLTMTSKVLPLLLKRTFPPIIWIFTEGEGDGIESRLPFEIFSTFNWTFCLSCFLLNLAAQHGLLTS